MLRCGETEKSSMKKYGIDAYLKKQDEVGSMNSSIRKSVSCFIYFGRHNMFLLVFFKKNCRLS